MTALLIGYVHVSTDGLDLTAQRASKPSASPPAASTSTTASPAPTATVPA